MKIYDLLDKSEIISRSKNINESIDLFPTSNINNKEENERILI